MTGFAAPDYEPTAAEIGEFLAGTFTQDSGPGSHGTVTIIPAFERYIWRLPVFWGHRTVNADGTITYAWAVPAPCPERDL